MSNIFSISEIAEINKTSINAKDNFGFINYLDTSSLTRNKISEIQFLCDDFPSRAKRKVKNNTILYSTVRPNQEHFGIVEKNEIDNLIVSTGFATIDVISKDILPKFLFYKLTQPFITNYLQGIAENSVSAYPSIKPDSIASLRFIFPDLSTQQKIASVLSALDDKIELNNRINAELEAMAKTLYDYWFVQFDFPNSPPLEGWQNSKNFDGVVGYKSSGGKMVYNETLKREIPEGWEVKTVGDFAKIKKGTLITERTANINGNVKVVSAGLDFSYYHSESNFSNNTITISASGANAGYINFWREPIFACDCTTVRGNNDFETFYILQFLKSVQEFIFSQARGSAQPHVYPKDIESLKIIIPNEEILHKYGEIVYSMNEKITNNLKQNQELSALRDWLLPMLMNGQVKVG